jgi:uncharacterized protein (DUF58 family)
MLATAMNWVERIAPVIRMARGPHDGDLRLDRRKIFILPTRAGLMFGVLLIIMLLTSVNYSLSLGYALTFLLVGVGVVSMLHTWRNLLGLTLRAGRAEPVHAGELAELGLTLHNPRGQARYAIELTVPRNAQSTLIDVAAGVDQLIAVALPTDQRGWQIAPRMRLSTRWPLGLWQAWAWWHPQVQMLVLPRLETPAAPLPESSSTGNEFNGRGRGEDDFSAIRAFREGDSTRRLAWKAMARSGRDDLLVLEFEGGGGQLWLDWSAMSAALPPEDRLSRLARWVVDAESAGLSYGLRLNSVTIDRASGAAHRAECLQALALAQV